MKTCPDQMSPEAFQACLPNAFLCFIICEKALQEARFGDGLQSCVFIGNLWLYLVSLV